MQTTPPARTALLADAGREIHRSCGGGRVVVRTFPGRETVRVEIHLVDASAQHCAIAEAEVYSRLSAAGIPCQVAA